MDLLPVDTDTDTDIDGDGGHSSSSTLVFVPSVKNILCMHISKTYSFYVISSHSIVSVYIEHQCTFVIKFRSAQVYAICMRLLR